MKASACLMITGLTNQGASPVELQKDFNRVRDNLLAVELPLFLIVNDYQLGIKNELKPVVKIISKNARYTDTALKALEKEHCFVLKKITI